MPSGHQILLLRVAQGRELPALPRRALTLICLLYVRNLLKRETREGRVSVLFLVVDHHEKLLHQQSDALREPREKGRFLLPRNEDPVHRYRREHDRQSDG